MVDGASRVEPKPKKQLQLGGGGYGVWVDLGALAAAE